MRLAFAVAAHLDPEILIVDEVLAVGDMEFQKKCIGRMREVAKSGRVVLFVSHNMASIRNLCKLGVVLNKGRIATAGNLENCVKHYTSGCKSRQNHDWVRTEQTPVGNLAISKVSAVLTGQQPRHILLIEIELVSRSDHRPAYLEVEVSDPTGVVLMQAIPTIQGFLTSDRPKHQVCFEVELPPLIPGYYGVSVIALVHNSEVLDNVREVVAFEIEKSPVLNRTYPHFSEHGFLVPHSRLITKS